MTGTGNAAVLVPLYTRREGGIGIVVVERSHHGAHGGQIAFPGGKPEPGDDDLRATALREAAEETGLDPAAARIIAALPVVSTRVSGFRIQPFLGRIEPPTEWRPQAREINRIITLDLATLAHPAARQRRNVVLPNGERLADVPCFDVHPVPIWGATYRILAPLVPRLRNGEITL